MDDVRITKSKTLFKTYLEVYLIYNNSQFPAELGNSFFLGRPMLLAFVCELGLKTLVLQSGREYNRIHLLNHLFDLINPEIQQIIIKVLNLEESEFKAKLSKSANIFVKWRYFTEEGHSTADTKFIENLITIVTELLLGRPYMNELSLSFRNEVYQKIDEPYSLID